MAFIPPTVDEVVEGFLRPIAFAIGLYANPEAEKKIPDVLMRVATISQDRANPLQNAAKMVIKAIEFAKNKAVDSAEPVSSEQMAAVVLEQCAAYAKQYTEITVVMALATVVDRIKAVSADESNPLKSTADTVIEALTAALAPPMDLTRENAERLLGKSLKPDATGIEME